MTFGWNRPRRAIGGALLLAGCGGSEAQEVSTASAAVGGETTAPPIATTSGASANTSGNASTESTGEAASPNNAGATDSSATSTATTGQGGTGAGGSSSVGDAGGNIGSAGANGGDVSGNGGTGGSALLGMPIEAELAALPSDRQEHGVVAANGEIFVLGGYAPSVTASVIAYDPAADRWHSVADFPSPFNHPQAGVVRDKIYVAGFYAGTSLTGPATGRTFVYDPIGDGWSERKGLPAGSERAGGCVAVLGTNLYVFGGGNSGEPTSFASVYDTAEDTWRELPPLPETREHCAAFASGTKLYIASGRTHTVAEFRPTTLEFDPETETYEDRTPIPTPRGGAASAVLGGLLFVFGGEGADNAQGVFPDVEAYDPKADAWQAFPLMLVPRHGFGAATLGDRIYLAGGAIREGGGASDTNTVFYFE